MTNKKDLELYIHIPFCVRKCRYCDFISFAGCEARFDDYVKALCREIEYVAPAYQDRKITSIYLGGGTPSLLSSDHIETISRTIRSAFPVKLTDYAIRRWLPKPGFQKKREKKLPEPEFSIECNPGTIDREKLVTYQKCGINRLSIGLQSTDNEDLKVLGRIHTYEDFVQTFELAREVGFTNINVDLMQAIPGQTLTGWQKVLALLGLWRPEHISAYSLIIEPGTEFYRLNGQGKLFLPDEDTERKIYYYTRDFLGKAGYERYEISNYARPGYACRHNIGYWRRTDYLGVGLHASSMVDNTRWKNTDNLDLYIESLSDVSRDFMSDRIREEQEVLSYREQMEEFMILGLRMTDGVSREEFLNIFHQDLEIPFGSIIHRMMELGLMESEEDRIFLTDRGFDVSNTVLAEFLA